jgi:uncharacterized protein (DUF362 family)
MTPISRRGFLQVGVTGFASLAIGQRPALGEEITSVAVVKVGDGGREAAIREALDLLRFPPLNGKHVLLKPNWNSADPFPGSTHPAMLEALIKSLWRLGAREITVADRSGMGYTPAVMRTLGVPETAKALDVKALAFDDLPRHGWVHIQDKSLTWKRGFSVPRLLQEADAVVQTCCLKTHRYGGHFTLSLKNTIGLVAKYVPGDTYNYMGELHTSPHQRALIAETNLAYRPALVILDGVEAFVDGGPDTGRNARPGVLIVGTDRVAVDAVGVAALREAGTNPTVSRGVVFAQDQIARAVGLGLGVRSASQIRILAPDPSSEAYAARLRSHLMSRG